SWKEFAEARKSRSLRLYTSKIGGDSFDIDEIVKAKRVDLMHVEDKELPQCLVSQPMGWKILSGSESQVQRMAHIQCPDLRRLILVDFKEKARLFDPNSFLSSIEAFTKITWFECHTDKFYMGHLNIIDDEREPVELPNEIWFMSEGNEIGDFPPWSEVPRLEHFEVDANLKFNFQGLPLEHPLKRIIVRHWSIDNISTWLDSSSMQHIRLLTSNLKFEVSLYGPSLALRTKEQEMDRLFAKAKENSVHLEVFVFDYQSKPIVSEYATKRLT
ncbi:5587_t:CDS:2, partial [Acaulospora colombiana]